MFRDPEEQNGRVFGRYELCGLIVKRLTRRQRRENGHIACHIRHKPKDPRKRKTTRRCGQKPDLAFQPGCHTRDPEVRPGAPGAVRLKACPVKLNIRQVRNIGQIEARFPARDNKINAVFFRFCFDGKPSRFCPIRDHDGPRHAC